MGSFIELLTTVLKIFFFFLKKYVAFSIEEKRRFEERMKGAAQVLKEVAESKEESMNEESYLSNLDWETKKRYESYKKGTLDILSEGGGMPDLRGSEVMGLGERVRAKDTQVLDILKSQVTVEEKSKLIAKLLTE